MLKEKARRATAGARAAGGFIVRHRLLGAGAVLLILLALGASAQSALGRGQAQTFPGTSAAGSHRWYSLDQESAFCNRCHSQAHDAGFHGGDPCASCHEPKGEAHAASPAQCTDCHAPLPAPAASPAPTGVPTPPPAPMADLTVAKADTPDPVSAGANLTYSVTVTNLGPGTAQGVVLTDTLPRRVTLVSATPSQGSCTGATCQLGDIPARSSASVSIVVSVDRLAAIAIQNTACASSSTADPNPNNNCDTESTRVVRR